MMYVLLIFDRNLKKIEDLEILTIFYCSKGLTRLVCMSMRYWVQLSIDMNVNLSLTDFMQCGYNIRFAKGNIIHTLANNILNTLLFNQLCEQIQMS